MEFQTRFISREDRRIARQALTGKHGFQAIVQAGPEKVPASLSDFSSLGFAITMENSFGSSFSVGDAIDIVVSPLINHHYAIKGVIIDRQPGKQNRVKISAVIEHEQSCKHQDLQPIHLTPEQSLKGQIVHPFIYKQNSYFELESLSKNAGNDYWNGTIQLAIGLRTSKTENEKYLTELLSKAKGFESDHDLNSATSLYLLVLSCKENMREITPRFSYQLKEVIKKVVPPPTAKVRDALASAGSIAIPYLARPRGGQSIIKDHYCALALIKIATPDSYIMLKEYLKDNRPK